MTSGFLQVSNNNQVTFSFLIGLQSEPLGFCHFQDRLGL